MKLLFFTIFLSFLGFLDATYLTILHYKNIIPPCSLAHGCETVLTSEYAQIGSVPLALIGVFYFILLITILIAFWETKNKIVFKLLILLTTSSLIISLILVALQAFIIHAFCQYCLGVEGINILIFIFIFFHKKGLSY